jgi:hypothetical protein
MLKRIVAPTKISSRQFNFLVPDDVIDAVARYIDCSAPGRIISTFSAVQSVRDKVCDCELSDDQIERYAVLFAADQGLAVHFDRRGNQRDLFSSLARSHWRLLPMWQIKSVAASTYLFHRSPSGGLSAFLSENNKAPAGAFDNN